MIMIASYKILELRQRLVPLNMFKPFSNSFTNRYKATLLLWFLFLLFMFHVCVYYTVLTVPCRNGITCWERADLLAHLCVMFSCVFVTFPHGVSGQVWNLIVSVPDLCLPDKIAFVMVMIATAYGILQHLSKCL